MGPICRLALGPPPRPRAVAGAGWSAEGANPLSAKLLGAGPTGRRPGEGAEMGPAEHAGPVGPERTGGGVAQVQVPAPGPGSPGADDPAGDAAELRRPSSCPVTEGARAAPSTVARETLPALSHRTSPAGHVNPSVLLFLDFLRGSIHPPIIGINTNYRRVAPALDTCGSQLPHGPQRGPSGLGLTGADLALSTLGGAWPRARCAAPKWVGWGVGTPGAGTALPVDKPALRKVYESVFLQFSPTLGPYWKENTSIP